MQTTRERETQKDPQSEGNVASADESLGVLQQPKAETLSPVRGVAQDITEEHPEVDTFAASKGIMVGIGLSLILGCLFTVIRYWIS